MKPGERIRLIKESAERLGARPWAEAQLTLDQFGFVTYDSSNSYDFDPDWYFIQQVKEGADDKIAALHEYLLGEDAGPSGRSIELPWGALPVALFLSHIHEHRDFVGRLKRLLAANYGIDAFVAHDDIQPSKQWREVIKAALSSCHAFVAFLHPGFHESQWCDQEVGWALGRGIPVITVRPEESERRDGFLEEHQDILLGKQGEGWVADQIFEIILNDPRTKPHGLRALAEAFVNSTSYDSTRKWVGLLIAQDAIEPEQLRRLEYAVQTNRQVYEAEYGRPGRPVPELIREIVKRHEPPPAEPWPDYTEEPF